MRKSKSHLLTISVLLVCMNGCVVALELNCPPSQHLVNGECVPVNTALDCPAETPVPCNGVCIDPKTSDLYCGANADCTNFIACGPNAYCHDGICTAKQCPEGQHTAESGCEPDTLEHCGETAANCTALNGWKDGICQNGQCIIQACLPGFHLFNNTCEANTLENCGHYGMPCNATTVPNSLSSQCVDGVCIALTCNDDSYLFNNACEPNTVENCGAHGKRCDEQIPYGNGHACVSGNCTATSCDAGYYLHNGQCFANDNENCGGHNKACSTGYVCKQGSCQKAIVGDIITFGHYEQDNNTTNGKEPIEWRILDINAAGQYLVISDKVLEAKRYNKTYRDITWEKSTIRSWLNGYAASYNSDGINYTSNNFIDAAFTAEEQAKIVASYVPAHKNPSYSTSPGHATTDKIFLLSIVEAYQYFPNATARLADATRYAVKQGLYVRGTDTVSTSGGTYSYDGTCANVHCRTYWWLRSPGFYSSSAAYVLNSGAVYADGDAVYDGHYGVRPTLWLEY